MSEALEARLHGVDLFGEPATPTAGSILAERFGVPPFSVISAREGDWQNRKRAWLGLGIESEVGRDDELLHSGSVIDTAVETWEGGRAAWQNTGASVFDPALCELLYTWFCPERGQVVDPFAGGSVRGIVATLMGYKYWGSELRPEQVRANAEQANTICPEARPFWRCGDAVEVLPEAPPADFIFSCPPYGDLEVYSDDPKDLSTMDYPDFMAAMFRIIQGCYAKLKPNRFACFVVGEFRDKAGNYRNFVGDTVSAFQAAGFHFYNEAILVTSVGSLPVRAGRQFDGGRKLGKTHQNILVFVKGDGKAASKAITNL